MKRLWCVPGAARWLLPLASPRIPCGHVASPRNLFNSFSSSELVACCVLRTAAPTHRQKDYMLLRRIGLIGSFVFHGGAAKRSCPGFSSSTHTQQSLLSPGLFRRASTRNRVGVEMSSASADDQTRIVTGIRELCDRYDGFILDQFGVLHGEYSST